MQSSLCPKLVGDSVGQRVREGNADLQDVGAGSFKSSRDFNGLLKTGITARDVYNEGASIFSIESREFLVNPVHHLSTE